MDGITSCVECGEPVPNLEDQAKHIEETGHRAFLYRAVRDEDDAGD